MVLFNINVNDSSSLPAPFPTYEYESCTVFACKTEDDYFYCALSITGRHDTGRGFLLESPGNCGVFHTDSGFIQAKPRGVQGRKSSLVCLMLNRGFRLCSTIAPRPAIIPGLYSALLD